MRLPILRTLHTPLDLPRQRHPFVRQIMTKLVSRLTALGPSDLIEKAWQPRASEEKYWPRSRPVTMMRRVAIMTADEP